MLLIDKTENAPEKYAISPRNFNPLSHEPHLPSYSCSCSCSPAFLNTERTSKSRNKRKSIFSSA
jgi:hypothetical protein